MKNHYNRQEIIIIAAIGAFVFFIVLFLCLSIFCDGYTESLVVALWIAYMLIIASIVLFTASTLAKKYFKQRQIETDLQNATIISSNATVIDKQTEVIGNRYRTTTLFYVIFELPDAQRKNFKVTQDIYAVIEKNDTGNLSFKEANGNLLFISFKRIINTDK